VLVSNMAIIGCNFIAGRLFSSAPLKLPFLINRKVPYYGNDHGNHYCNDYCDNFELL
jgi:hypothetical protein